MADRLRDAQKQLRRRSLKTFPSRLPMIRIDHVFISRSIVVTGVHAPRNALVKAASDHVPLAVDFRIESRA